jgi:hypothetical protein
LEFYIDGNRRLGCSGKCDGGSTMLLLPTPIKSGTWVHVAARFDGTHLVFDSSTGEPSAKSSSDSTTTTASTTTTSTSTTSTSSSSKPGAVPHQRLQTRVTLTNRIEASPAPMSSPLAGALVRLGVVRDRTTPFDGAMADVRFYPRALSHASRAKLFTNNKKTTGTKGLFD